MRETSESSDTPVERGCLESTIRQRRLTPEERDAIVRKYNEELLTPHERDAILGKVKPELHSCRDSLMATGMPRQLHSALGLGL
jgi:hypothetical protein